MAERKRSTDGSRDTDKLMGEEGAVDQTGRSGGAVQRDIATEDILKRSNERPAGATRVTKSKERDDGEA